MTISRIVLAIAGVTFPLSPLIAQERSASPDPELRRTAIAAFHDWQVKGEGSGRFEAFLGRLASPTRFKLFSHPSLRSGPLAGVEGWAALRKMAAEHRAAARHLSTGAATIYRSGRSFAFQYRSVATGGRGTRNASNNILVLAFDPRGRVEGFREYVGAIEPQS